MSGRQHALDTVPGLRALLRRQHGLARRAQLRALGVDDHHVARQILAGRWRLVAPEVVSADNGRLDVEQLRWRAVLHAPTGWLGGRSALAHLGLQGFPTEVVDILVPRGARPARVPGVVLHVSDRLDGLELGPSDALPVTPAARATVDAAAWSPHPRLAAGLTIDVVRQGLATVEEIDAELASAGRIRNKIAVREALAGAREGAESMAEVDLGPLLRSAGIWSFRRQVRFGGRRHDVEAVLADGTVLVVEVDGRAHESAERRWVDAERDLAAAADGKITVRIPAFAVRHEPLRVVALLARIAGAARRRASHR